MALRVAEGEEDEVAGKLYRLSSEQQWTKEWTINRIQRVHMGASRDLLGEFAPADDCGYNFFVTVKAATPALMVEKALPIISKAVGHRHRGRHHHRGGHVVIHSDEQNGP